MNDLVKKIDQIKTLKNGKGIQYLLDEAYKIIGNPMILFDIEYNLLAYTNVFTDDPIFSEIIAKGNFSYETQKFFMEEGFIDSVASAKTVTFMLSEKLKYERILGKVFDKDHLQVANLVIVANNRRFEDESPMVLEAFCEVLSHEIIKNEFYQNYGLMYQENYIKKLIDGSLEEKRLYAGHIEIVYTGLKDYLHLVVADITQCDPELTKLIYFRDLFKKEQSTYKYSIYSNYIVIIMSSDEIEQNVRKDLTRLEKIFRRNKIYAGVSSQFENLFELPKYYQEAISALSRGIEISNQCVFLYDQLKF